MRALNVNGSDFCGMIGLGFHSSLLKALRDLDLVSFFKVGTKYMYASDDVKKISEMLHRGEISIKTKKGVYYVTLNTGSVIGSKIKNLG